MSSSIITPSLDVTKFTGFPYEKMLPSILKCTDELKLKNMKDYDRVHQIIISDGLGSFTGPLTNLFKLVYRDHI